MRKNVLQLFGKQAGPLQRRAIEAWLSKPGNEELYYEWLEEWERQHNLYEGSTDKRFEAYRDFMEESRLAESVEAYTEPTPLVSRVFSIRTMLAAACAALMVGFGFWWFSEAGQYCVIQTAQNEVKTIKLDDGSRVKLMGNASLKVPRWGFAKNQREVWLSGRADFDVIHTKSHQPFVVRTSHNWRVMVLGTVFSVRTTPRESAVRLQSGKVKLLNRVGTTERSLILKPGETAQLTEKNGWQVRAFPQDTRSEWKEKRFDFRALTLQQVGQQLSEDYNIRVQITDQALAERVLMGSLRARTLDELLQAIALLLNASVERHGNVVIFSTSHARPNS